LEHYLYAGREMHKIVNAGGEFIGQGSVPDIDFRPVIFKVRYRYKDAGEALKRKQDKEREAAGLPPVQRLGARAAAPQRGQRGAPAGRGGQRGTPAKAAPVNRGGGPSRPLRQADQSVYIHLIGLLRKNGLLPVVIFTFSKKKCEQNAATLTNLDLSSSVEKSEIHVMIEKSVMRLKGKYFTRFLTEYSEGFISSLGSDKKLPQIGRMRDLLSRGIGVHHGGLLPLVKEVRCFFIHRPHPSSIIF
jgi:antiviral helicase SKI2